MNLTGDVTCNQTFREKIKNTDIDTGVNQFTCCYLMLCVAIWCCTCCYLMLFVLLPDVAHVDTWYLCCHLMLYMLLSDVVCGVTWCCLCCYLTLFALLPDVVPWSVWTVTRRFGRWSRTPWCDKCIRSRCVCPCVAANPTEIYRCEKTDATNTVKDCLYQASAIDLEYLCQCIISDLQPIFGVTNLVY